ncbi:PspA/IM30 family protein [Neobacillus rhizophilus]|uniref:PspA/IM30 family protein n=1 Tax=Neobacillus rhizophilus TaxID=2833579 RepID=A0A942UC99_9BACI|nr:PspA/IM30 family protein [Neobacillus rhizophilus]MBS4216296.1 PspA/IM30 family protein [Neobacillus rhizophilus]
MGIFKRIKTIAKADINGLLDSLEDPIAMLNEYSREIEQELVKAQKALSRQFFAENKLAALILDTKALVEKRTRQAKLAIEQGEETMAKLAVQEKLTQEKQLNLYEQQYEAMKGQTEVLNGKIQELQQFYHDLQQKKLVLASRANVALSMKQIQKATVSFQTDTIARGIARAEDKILLMEAEVQVQAGSQFALPVTQFNSFVNEDELNKEIEKLKTEKELLV